MNDINMRNLNDEALEGLCSSDFLKAQSFFRKNIKNNPCFISYNNLGAFYITEGIQLPNGKVLQAVKLGLKLLKKAQVYLPGQFKNLMAIGEAYFQLGQYNDANSFFLKACKICKTSVGYYNAGVSSYLIHSYRSAFKYLKEAELFCNDMSCDMASICVAQLYSILALDVQECSKLFKKYYPNKIGEMELDSFILAYYCGELEIASELIDKILQLWIPEITILAMMLDCLWSLNKKSRAEECLQQYIEILEGFDLDMCSQIRKAKNIFNNAEYRKRILLEFQYMPPLKKGCYYIGCLQHPLI